MYLDICMFVRTCMKIGRYFGGREMLVWSSPTCFFAKLGLHQKSKKMMFVDSPIMFLYFGKVSAEFVMLEGLFFQSGGAMLSSFSLPFSFRDCCFRLLWSGAAFFLFWWCCRRTVLPFLSFVFFAASPGGLDLLAGWLGWLGRFGFGLVLVWFSVLLIVFLCLGVVTLQKHFVPGRGWWLRGWSIVRSWPCVRVKDFRDGHGCTLCSASATCREAPPERKSTKCGSDHSTRHCFIVGSSDLFVRLDSRGCFCVFEVCPGFRKKSPMTEQNTNQDIPCIWNCVHFFLDLLLPLHGRDPSVHVAWFVLRFKNFKKFEQSKSCCQTQGLAFSRSFYDDDFFYLIYVWMDTFRLRPAHAGSQPITHTHTQADKQRGWTMSEKPF